MCKLSYELPSELTRLRILKNHENFNKIYQKLGIDGKTPAGPQNETLTVVLENC